MIKQTFTRSGYCYCVIYCTCLEIQAQQTWLPREPSPAASVSQTVGISTISVNYSRPSVKGREVWGTLVPYGWNVQGFGLGNSAPWRAGANENTVLHLSHAAKVEGTHGSCRRLRIIFCNQQRQYRRSYSFKRL